MPSSPVSFNASRRVITYARARLFLGISGVGSATLAAALLLFFDVPAQGLSTSAAQSLPRALFSLGAFLLLVILAFLSFDLIGGAWLVRRRVWASMWLARWARGASVQLMLWLGSAALLLMAARAAGAAGAIGAFVLLQFALAACRGALSGVIAQLTPQPLPDVMRQAAQRAGLDPARIRCVDTPDEGFVGGYTGIRARTLMVPLLWAQLPESALTAQLTRRRLIGESGAHLRGVLGAIAWNTLGLATVVLATGADLATSAGILTMAAGMTLWAFLGVLVLPTPSRLAVFAVDRAAAQLVGGPTVQNAVELLDRWQDDEPSRSRRVETIFHPVPSRTTRAMKLAQSSAGPRTAREGTIPVWHAHHLARHALWLSWAALTPLPRAVHCNVGRPALWAMLPGD